ncbi:hypothetical protein [Moraxella caviae]|uniref:hypothetical protein n=1 Tax=Moraxella caviae TaxID=34060 RepID=UPI0011C020B0|nr:hypothetical protein [Moraxella caviae]
MNLKHGAGVINAQKLLKQAISYDIPCYVYGSGFSVMACDVFFKDEIARAADGFDWEKEKRQQQKAEAVEKEIENLVNHFLFYDGCFLKVSNVMLSHVLFCENNGQSTQSLNFHENIFDGYLSTAWENGEHNENFFGVAGKDFWDEVESVNLLPVTNALWLEDVQGEKVYSIDDIKKLTSLKFTHYEINTEKFELCPFFEIGLKDLIIFHKDLKALENHILNSDPIPEKQTPALGHLAKLNQPLHSRTANNAAKVIAAMAELLKMDITTPYGNESNGKILGAAEKLGLQISPETIAKWLKSANQEQSK